jgi:hypothetical protein
MIAAHAREVTSAKASHATSGKTADMTSAEAADVTSAEATDVTSAEAAAHMASATTTSVATATATAAAGLCISGKKAAGKRCTRQNHHHSSYHDISFGMGGPSATGPCQALTCPRKAHANIAMD